jgi:RNA polymerase sigma-70 factor (ECF subfamily)
MADMQAGSVAALGVIYDRYSDRAYRVARSVDGAHADEAVQDAFVAIWDSKASYRPEQATAAPWLLTVVRHRAIDVARRNRRDEFHRASDDARPEDRRSRDDVAGHVIERDSARRLLVLLAQLPDAQQEVIVLAFHGQMTYVQIAEHLELPLGTIKGRMRLGLEKLRRECSSQPAPLSADA